MTCANHPDRERVAFCQNCGKPLCAECSRTVGQAVFCEPCLAARLAGAGSYPGGGTASAGTAPGGFTGTIPPPSAPGEPNPGLAALLGFIPGVGAFYNGQYAKGVVHLIVFAILISLVDEHGIFGLFIAGWIFYQVIEAHHTARARRDGTPLPNPFGLNDIGERLGFGRAWPSGGSSAATGYAPPNAAAGAPNASVPSPTASVPQNAYSAGWSAPEENFSPPSAPYAPEPPYGASWQPFTAGQAYAGVPPAGLYDNPVPPDYTTAAARGRSLPTGAFVLIGLGAFFLLANTGHFGAFAVHWFVPFLLIGFGVWTFVRRMTSTGLSISDDGSAVYRLRLYSAARQAVWPILIGLLFLLDITGVLSWSHSWPLLIVLAGVLALLRRAAYAGIPPAPFPGVPATPMGARMAGAAPGTTPSTTAVDTHHPDNLSGDRS